jgi:hypothetical protein
MKAPESYDIKVRIMLTQHYNWQNPAKQIDIQPLIRELIDEGYWFGLPASRVAGIIHMEIGQIIT